MNHCVPDFEIAEEDAIPCSSGYFFPQKSSMPNENIAELIWRNGKLIMQSKSQRSPKKSSLPSMNISTGDPVLPTSMNTTEGAGCSTTPQIESSHVCTENHLFMEEDEMATWLHYPIEDLCTDECTQVSSGCFPESSTAEQSDSKRLATNFMDSSRMKAKGEEFHPNLCDTRELIHVGSSEPSLGLVTSRELPESVISSEIGAAQLNTMPIKGLKDVGPSEPTISSSSGGSDGSAERSLLPATSYLKRKRTGDIEDSDCPGEDAGFEFMGTKKAPRQSTSTRRARAAEVHNLSERKRRDRINEKMRTLQELIPHCNKLDKASVLDEAIEYLKSLQLQVQMMSMGCNMSPIMYPSIQQYMTPMGMGMDMMAAGMRPMMQFNPFLAGSAMASPNLTQFGPRFPIQGFHIPRAPPQDHTRVQSTSQSEQALNISTLQGTMPIQPSSIIDSYQQYLDFNQLQQPHQQDPWLQRRLGATDLSSTPRINHLRKNLGTNKSMLDTLKNYVMAWSYALEYCHIRVDKLSFVEKRKENTETGSLCMREKATVPAE